MCESSCVQEVQPTLFVDGRSPRLWSPLTLSAWLWVCSTGSSNSWRMMLRLISDDETPGLQTQQGFHLSVLGVTGRGWMVMSLFSWRRWHGFLSSKLLHRLSLMMINVLIKVCLSSCSASIVN